MKSEGLAVEQFLTVQGEGRSVGRSAYFIRLAGCNLWCRWCDSLHAVDPKQFRGMTQPIDYSLIPDNCPLVVITGGEPTLFDLANISAKLRAGRADREIEIESNATIYPADVVDLFHWNLSPKLKSSGQLNGTLDRKRLGCLQQWADYSRSGRGNVTFKFVITAESDLEEVMGLVEAHGLPKSMVYLMAEGQTPESQGLLKTEPLIEFAKKNGVNFSPRLHILYWGNRRGV